MASPPLAARWANVGHSTAADASQAGREAAQAALAGADARLIIVFASNSYDLSTLLAAINETTGGVPLIGCSTAGEIAADAAFSHGVVVTALGGGFDVTTAATSISESGPRAAGANAAMQAATPQTLRNRICMLFIDGLLAGQDEVVRGAYDVLGASVPLVGGAAGDDTGRAVTAQLHGSDVLHGSVVSAVIDSDGPFGIGVKHGWRPVGEPMSVTHAADGRVYTLDDRPALDAYLERVDAPAAAYTDPAVFGRFAITRPLSVRRPRGDEVRGIDGGADFVGRSLACGAEIPQGGLTWVMEGDAQSVLDATDEACRDAVDALKAPPIALIAFDCRSRRVVLDGHDLHTEVALITKHAGAACVSGFCTFGEIARARGVNGFHHQTLVAFAIG